MLSGDMSDGAPDRGGRDVWDARRHRHLATPDHLSRGLVRHGEGDGRWRLGAGHPSQILEQGRDGTSRAATRGVDRHHGVDGRERGQVGEIDDVRGRGDLEVAVVVTEAQVTVANAVDDDTMLEANS